MTIRLVRDTLSIVVIIRIPYPLLGTSFGPALFTGRYNKSLRARAKYASDMTIRLVRTR
jgi:hypothetical protein